MTDSARPPAPSTEWTVLLHFEMGGSEEQRAFLEAYRPVVEAYVSDWPGFLGATLYASTDGTRVVNHTRWVDEAAYRDYLERSEPAPRLRAIEAALASVPGLRGPDMQITHTYRPALEVAPATNAGVS